MVTLCGTLVHSGRRWYLTSRETPPLPSAANSKTSNIRANFENLAKEKAQEDRRRAEAERAQRMAKERQEQEEARRQLDVSEGARGQAAGEEGAVKHRSPTASFEIPSSLHPWGVSQPPHTATQWRGGGSPEGGVPMPAAPPEEQRPLPCGPRGATRAFVASCAWPGPCRKHSSVTPSLGQVGGRSPPAGGPSAQSPGRAECAVGLRCLPVESAVILLIDVKREREETALGPMDSARGCPRHQGLCACAGGCESARPHGPGLGLWASCL